MLLASLVCALAPLCAQDTSSPGQVAVRNERVLRYYNLKGKLDVGDLNEAARDAGLEIVYGPLEAASRPSISVVVVSSPTEMGERDVERALKKAGARLEALEVFLFRGRVENGFPTFGGAATRIDYMLGMSGDIRWCDMQGEWTQFYCVPGKLDAQELEELWRKLQRPLGDEPATLGELVRETWTWTLLRELEPSEQKKLTKELGKLDGVVAAKFEGTAMTVAIALEGLSLGGPPTSFDGTAAERGTALRATFATAAIFELLEKRELVGD